MRFYTTVHDSQSHITATGFQFRTQFGLEVLHLDGLHVFAAGEAGRPGDLGQCLLIGRGKVDHQEDPVRHVGTRAVQAFAVGCEGREELGAAFRVLKVQSDDVGHIEFTV